MEFYILQINRDRNFTDNSSKQKKYPHSKMSCHNLIDLRNDAVWSDEN